ncbi:MAG: lipid II flippase MurJ, partial [Pseudomonadota bacterium]
MSTLAKSTLALTAALMLGRLLGFLREVLLAARVGVSAEADMAVLILTLPDFLISVLMAGGFGAALVPALRRLEGAERMALFRFATTLALVVALALAGVIAAAPDLVFRLLAPALPPEVIAPHLFAMQLTALSVPLAALSGVLGALLNARNTFFVVGLGTGVYNFVLCAFLLGLPPGMALILPLALAVLAAATTRLAMLWFAARPAVLPRLRAPP